MWNTHLFPTSTYQQRRAALLRHLDGQTGLALFMGNNESPMNYHDNVYPFRQDASFRYFFGLAEPGLVAVMDLDSGQATLYGDDPTVEHVVWTGPQTPFVEKAQRVGIAHTQPTAKLSEALQATQQQSRNIHFLPQYRADNQISLSQILDTTVAEVRQGASRELIQAVVALRAIKTGEEVAEMEKALTVTAAMHHAVMEQAEPGQVEQYLAGIAEGLSLTNADGLAYPIILTINGQTLHNHHHHNVLQNGQLLLCDMGAAVASGYASDITRTLPVDYNFSTRQRDIYNIVLEAQEAAIDTLKPGVPFREIHLLSAAVLVDGLKALGLMQGDTQEAVRAGAHALFFPHGLGHLIGLDVHDMEGLGEDHVGYGAGYTRSDQFGLRALRLARPLRAGHVVTVEPGLYFIPELIDLWKSERKCADFIRYDALASYRDFGGIRIEDNLLITDSGYRLLGPPIAKTVEEVEARRRAYA